MRIGNLLQSDAWTDLQEEKWLTEYNRQILGMTSIPQIATVS